MKDKIEIIRESLPTNERQFSYHPVFTLAAEAMIDFVEGSITKEEYAEKYNDWRQYLELKL